MASSQDLRRKSVQIGTGLDDGGKVARQEASMSLRGKTLFITGASRGIGLAIALRAARDGGNIVVAAKTDQLDPRLADCLWN